jgi:hypothetical protein
MPRWENPCRHGTGLLVTSPQRRTLPLSVCTVDPGALHTYLTPFQDLNSTYDIPVILYDQAVLRTREEVPPPSVLTKSLFLSQSWTTLFGTLGIEEFDLRQPPVVGRRCASQPQQPPRGRAPVARLGGAECAADDAPAARTAGFAHAAGGRNWKRGGGGSAGGTRAASIRLPRTYVQAVFQSLKEDPTVYMAMTMLGHSRVFLSPYAYHYNVSSPPSRTSQA